jgi:class 3 adenylate cyclase
MNRIIQYFIPSNISSDADSQRKARLTVATWIIIACFNLNYVLISYFIHYEGGIWSQLPLMLITIACLFGYKYKFKLSLTYPFYFISCSISIAISVYFTDGFLSVLFSWLATTPIVAVLLWNKKGATVSVILVILIEILFFFLYSKDYVFPNQVAPEYRKFFYLTTHVGLALILFWIAIVFENAKDGALNKLNYTLNELKREKQRSDELLLNILPQEVAEELKEKGKAEAHYFDHVTVLFTDFANFTQASEMLQPRQLVQELHECFTAFDNIIERNGLEKIKTVGDAYLAVCGLPAPDPLHAQKTVKAALEIRNFIAERKNSAKVFEIRIGIHTGSVVAGIVGVKKFAYDIWGDTVNTAARMEQSCEPGKINISETTHELVKDDFTCIYRGAIEAKNKGYMDMYFVE